MNERLENLLYESGLTAQGCWDELDDYAKQGIERFAELIIRECAEIDFRHKVGLSFDDDFLISQAIKEYFGVEK